MVDASFFGVIKKLKLSELVQICGFKKVGEEDFVIAGVATLKFAQKVELSFFSNKKYIEDLRSTSAGAVILQEENIKYLPPGVVGLVCANAQLGYAEALNILYPWEKFPVHICNTARIHESAQFGEGCYIGENVVIEANVVVGANVYIGASSVVEKGCHIGSGSHVHSNVTISHSIIGCDVIIHSGARLGESGFGIIPAGRRMTYIKQLGRVIIGDRVRVGANTTIDRGSIEDTVIGNDTVIDNLVQIAHNVHIGDGTIIVAQVGIAGSTRIGNGVVLAGQVGVVGHIEIGDQVIAAAKSGIASSVEAGKVVGGIPAVDINIWKRQAAFLKKSVTRREKNSEVK